MLIYSIIAYTSLFISLVSLGFALVGYRWLYWLAALSIYIFSFLGGFSIGQFTVGFMFVFLTLAISHSLGWFDGKRNATLTICFGFLLGTAMVLFVDDKWLFSPFYIFLS